MTDQPPQVVYVEWVDTFGVPGWTTAEAFSDPSPLRCVTCGFLVRETDGVITVAASWTEVGKFDCPISIPWVAVTKYHTLEM